MPNREQTEAEERTERTRRDLRHDLRSSASAIMGLSQLLLDELDGPLTDEQRIQVTLIQDSARSITELVVRRLGTAAKHHEGPDG